MTESTLERRIRRLSADMTYARTASGWFIDSVLIHGGIRVPDA
jgi:hypothetical protein